MKSANLKGTVIRVDGASALQSLVNDVALSKLGIALEVDRLKNKNKNPVAEKAVQECLLKLKKTTCRRKSCVISPAFYSGSHTELTC